MTHPNQPYQPLVIIGAARSGTNVLRDSLTTVDGLATWPCDELPFVWRFGNRTWPNDELEPRHAGARTRDYIRRVFDRQAARSGAQVVVEKTCANTLRVPFVATVLPEARYVHLVRNGWDVVPSAMRRWTSSLDLGYSLRKLRYTPLRDVIPYGMGFVANRLHRARSGGARLARWGPAFAGMDEMAEEATLAELCAWQWRRCVEAAERGFAAVDPARVYRLRYEDFVQRPADHVAAIARFAGVTSPDCESLPSITTDRVGTGRTLLDDPQQRAVAPILDPMLATLGYGP